MSLLKSSIFISAYIIFGLAKAEECKISPEKQDELQSGRQNKIQSSIRELYEYEALKDKIIYSAEENKFTGHVTNEIRDKTALNGFCLRIAPDMPPYFTVRWHLENAINNGIIVEGLKYTLFGRLKIISLGSSGTAFRTGVYNAEKNCYIANDQRPCVADIMPGMWSIYKIGTFTADNKLFAYVGPTQNMENISDIFVDLFFLIPGDDLSELFTEALKRYQNSLAFSFNPDSSLSMEISGCNSFELMYFISDSSAKTNIYPEIEYQYHRKNDISFMPENSVKVLPAKLINKIFLNNKTGSFFTLQEIKIPLKEQAPPDWNGIATIKIINRASSGYFSGIITAPEINDINIRSIDISGEIKSLQDSQNKIKKIIFQKNLVELKKIVNCN